MSGSNGNNGRRRTLSVGIVGGGFGGIGMGIRLKQEGFYDFTIFERGDSIGGVWRANTYPGATCDVPSHAYSFSFAPGHQWSRRYAPRADILRYLDELVERFSLEPHIQLDTEVTSARFEEESGTWTLETGDGTEHRFDVLVTACGQLTNPAIPEIPGTDEFEGAAFHSAEWDHDHDLSGREVAVIGTGASAIQFVPVIAREAKRVTIYQRSAPWILPKLDRPYADWERRLFERFPTRVKVSRAGMIGFIEAATYGFTGSERVMRPFRAIAESTRQKALGDDPELLAKTTPDYEIGCKRILFTSEWYETLKRDNVELLNGRVERITPGGVVGPDGVERPAETIVYGTGFQTHDFVAPMEIHGLEGRELNEVWAERPEAYLGTTVSGFPNLFVMYGPNTNHGSGSVPYTLECQFNYALDALGRIRERDLRYLDLREEAQRAWREEIADRSERTVWTIGGCTNWYVTGEGVNTNNWPGGWFEFKRRTKRIEPADYRAVA